MFILVLKNIYLFYFKIIIFTQNKHSQFLEYRQENKRGGFLCIMMNLKKKKLIKK